MQTEQTATNVSSWNSPMAAKFGLLFLMYISQKVFLTFTWTLLPILLRQQNVSLGTIGFTALVYSPWSLKFIHASMVDRFYFDRFGKRKSWIVPLLLLSWTTLPLLAMLSPTADLFLVLGLIFVLNTIFATIDIAVDGYATDILAPGERPWGNTIQMVGYLIGYMLGAGLLLICYQHVGWSRTVLLITAIQLLLMLPVLLHKEMKPVAELKSTLLVPDDSDDRPSVRRLLRQPQALWFLLFLTIIALFDQGGNQLRLPLLVDLGIDARQLGHINIWVGAPVSILGALLAGGLLKRLGVRRMFILGCVGSAAVSWYSALLADAETLLLWQAYLLIGMDKLMIGLITVFTCSLTMTMSAGPQAATNYAVLTSAGHLIGFATMPFVGHLCDWIGYGPLFAVLTGSAFMAIFIGMHLLRNHLNFKH